MAECCPSHTSSRPPLSEVLEAAAGDPTLEACCARDMREQAYGAWLKSELQAHDRVDSRVKLVAGVVKASQPAAEPKDAADLTDDAGSDDMGAILRAQVLLDVVARDLLVLSIYSVISLQQTCSI